MNREILAPRRVLFVHIVFFIQFVHPIDINKNQDYEDIDGPLLGKPKAQFESANLYVVQCIGEEDATAIGNQKPYREKNSQIAQVGFPIIFQAFS